MIELSASSYTRGRQVM